MKKTVTMNTKNKVFATATAILMAMTLVACHGSNSPDASIGDNSTPSVPSVETVADNKSPEIEDADTSPANQTEENTEAPEETESVMTDEHTDDTGDEDESQDTTADDVKISTNTQKTQNQTTDKKEDSGKKETKTDSDQVESNPEDYNITYIPGVVPDYGDEEVTYHTLEDFGYTGEREGYDWNPATKKYVPSDESRPYGDVYKMPGYYEIVGHD